MLKIFTLLRTNPPPLTRYNEKPSFPTSRFFSPSQARYCSRGTPSIGSSSLSTTIRGEGERGPSGITVKVGTLQRSNHYVSWAVFSSCLTATTSIPLPPLGFCLHLGPEVRVHPLSTGKPSQLLPLSLPVPKFPQVKPWLSWPHLLVPRTCPPSLILSLSWGLAGDGCVGPASSSWWCFFLCFFLCFLCFFLCTPWPWAPARLNSSASPAEGEPVNGVRQEQDRRSLEEPNTPEGPHSSSRTHCYHNNRPAFLLPTCGEVPRRLGRAKWDSFSANA